MVKKGISMLKIKGKLACPSEALAKEGSLHNRSATNLCGTGDDRNGNKILFSSLSSTKSSKARTFVVFFAAMARHLSHERRKPHGKERKSSSKEEGGGGKEGHSSFSGRVS